MQYDTANRIDAKFSLWWSEIFISHRYFYLCSRYTDEASQKSEHSRTISTNKRFLFQDKLLSRQMNEGKCTDIDYRNEIVLLNT